MIGTLGGMREAKVPPKKLDAARALTKHIEFDVSIFEQIEILKKTGKLARNPKEVFAEYLKTIETIVCAVDTGPAPKGPSY